jgi:hypothetical protein
MRFIAIQPGWWVHRGGLQHAEIMDVVDVRMCDAVRRRNRERADACAASAQAANAFMVG